MTQKIYENNFKENYIKFENVNMILEFRETYGKYPLHGCNLFSAAVQLGFWNSDHVVLKSSIRTSASPRRQRSHWGVRVTQDAYFSLLIHIKQLLLVAFCDTIAEIEKNFGLMEDDGGRRTEGQTDVEVEIVI